MSTEWLQEEVFSVGSAQRLYKEIPLELWASSEFRGSGSAGRQSEKGDPGPWLEGHGQSSTVLSCRLGSAVLEPYGREE
jgi:hypothetical protein